MRREDKYFFHVTCAPGLEEGLKEELKEMGIRRLRDGRGAVRFQGTMRVGLKVALWSQVASRVLVELTQVSAIDGDDLYEAILDLPWEERMNLDSTFAIDVIGTSTTLRHTHYTGQRIKDGICDRFREKWGKRPNVDPRRPHVLIVARLHRNRCTISLDLVGERLHRRGYRVEQVEAPLKENLAAGILRLAGWDGLSPLIDPMCGGGTFVIEGALRAVKVAPGETLEPACLDWPWKGAQCREIWDDLCEIAREKSLANSPALIRASDIRPDNLEAAKANALQGGVKEEIEWSIRDARELDLPQGPGWIVCNPPYGERLETIDDAEELMREFGAAWKKTKGFHLAVIAPWEELPEWIGQDAVKVVPLRNGKIEGFLTLFAPAQPV